MNRIVNIHRKEKTTFTARGVAIYGHLAPEGNKAVDRLDDAGTSRNLSTTGTEKASADVG